MTSLRDERLASVGYEFSLSAEGGLIAPEAWGLHLDQLPPADRRAGRLLIRLMENEQAAATDVGLELPDTAVAALTDVELDALRLPPRAPFAVALRSDGLVTDPGYRVHVGFLRSDGRAVVQPRRDGGRLEVGDLAYTLGEPLYSILGRLERLNAAVDRGERLALWGEIREQLPGSAQLEAGLSDLKVVTASRLAIGSYVDAEHGLQLEPVPLSRHGAAVNPQQRRQFGAAFQKLRRPTPQIPLGEGWVLLMTPEVRSALEIVRRAQDLPEGERRRFAENPRAALRAAMPDLEPDVFDSLIAEDSAYSARVEGVGPWSPRQLPFLTMEGQEWIPTEEGILADPSIVATDDLPEAVDAVRNALAAGLDEVEVGGRKIAVSEESLRALENALERASIHEKGGSEPGVEPDATGKVALRIIDNLEEDAFAARRQAREGNLELPKGLRSTLLPHQQAALTWLQRHWLAGSHGALLADDMGLGKTLVALACLQWIRQQEPSRPVLVVAPTGLLKNWLDEAERHFEEVALGVPTRAYGGGLAALRDQRAAGRGNELTAAIASSVLDRELLQAAEWVLTTYETLRDYQFSFAAVQWGAVVFDEAQKIKNPTAMVTTAAKALNSEFTLALTGTPVENRLADLWCILDTCQPGLLGDLKSFCSTYEGADENRLRELVTLLTADSAGRPAVMLRRLKHDHLTGLPAKHWHARDRPMPPRQAECYSKVVVGARAAGEERSSMLAAIQRLRAVSLCPPIQAAELVSSDWWRSGARLQALIEDLDLVHAKAEKALIFLESLELQPLVAELIQRRYLLPSLPLIINGGVSGDRRKARVDAFQQRPGFDVMILSPKAGGVGLTLTAANHVFHLSRWWNPAVEDQCTDRVFRIGQQRPVHVYVPRAVHAEYGERSFDLQLHRLLERKRALSAEVLLPSIESGDALTLFRGLVTQEGE